MPRMVYVLWNFYYNYQAIRVQIIQPCEIIHVIRSFHRVIEILSTLKQVCVFFFRTLILVTLDNVRKNKCIIEITINMT